MAEHTAPGLLSQVQMRSEWDTLRCALDACVVEHAKRQEQLIACLNKEAQVRSSGVPVPPCPQDAPISPITAPGVASNERTPKQRTSDNSYPSEQPTVTDEESNGVTSPRKSSGRSGGGDEDVRSPKSPKPPPSFSPQGAAARWSDDGSGGIKNKIKRRIYKRCFKCIDWWMDLKEPPRQGRLPRFVHSGTFEAICAAVIMTNGVFATIAANLEVEGAFLGKAGRPYPIFVGEMFFLAFYTFELALKLSCHGCYLFVNEDMYWNSFDSSLVAFTLYDEGCVLLIGEGIGANVTFMRSLRILKMAKILRVVRVMRYFSELRLILQSLVGSLASLFWSIVMLALIFYIFALCFVQGMTAYLMETSENPEVETRADIESYFGTVQDTMLTLYKASTGGDDWSNYFVIVQATGGMYSTLFIFFIAFIQIALFNILTAIFVENAMKLAQPDRDAKALEVRKAEEQEKEALRKICKSLDTNDDGSLDVEEFANHIKHGKLKAYLSVLGLDVRDAEVFLKVLSSAAQDAPIEIEAFVEGCMRMKGMASSIDMQGLMFETKIIHKNLRQFYRDVLDQFAYLDRKTVLMSRGTNCTNGTGPKDSAEAQAELIADLVCLERDSLFEPAEESPVEDVRRPNRLETPSKPRREGTGNSSPMTL